MQKKSYDIIGDIHGRFDKLSPLLKALGYRHDGTAYAHPDSNRRAIFLGDLIDPKNETVPNGTREVLITVREMVEAGTADCILGNHEFNFIAYRTPNGEGDYLRPHSAKNDKMHAGTKAAFADHPTELEDIYVPWLKTLPFSLDLPGFRTVHACWDHKSLHVIHGRTLADTGFLKEATTKGTKEYDAVEITLKGVELPLPDGETFEDHTGTSRDHYRARWWGNAPASSSCRSLCFPSNPEIPDVIAGRAANNLPGYHKKDKVIFFGHYYKAADTSPEPESHNLYCLDFSAATDGPLACYHWTEGETLLFPENLHLGNPDKPLPLITAFLTTVPATDFEGKDAWQSLVNESGEPSNFCRGTYRPWVTKVLAELPHEDFYNIWTAYSDEGQEYDLSFYDEDPNREWNIEDCPPLAEMALNTSDHFLNELLGHAEHMHTHRENIEFLSENLHEDPDDQPFDPNDGPWGLSFVGNRDTASPNAGGIPVLGPVFENYYDAKAAAKEQNDEAREREGMFADLVSVVRARRP